MDGTSSKLYHVGSRQTSSSLFARDVRYFCVAEDRDLLIVPSQRADGKGKRRSEACTGTLAVLLYGARCVFVAMQPSEPHILTRDSQ
eukprot:21719-Eustigmatos_ZCMA.PRE.1